MAANENKKLNQCQSYKPISSRLYWARVTHNHNNYNHPTGSRSIIGGFPGIHMFGYDEFLNSTILRCQSDTKAVYQVGFLRAFDKKPDGFHINVNLFDYTKAYGHRHVGYIKNCTKLSKPAATSFQSHLTRTGRAAWMDRAILAVNPTYPDRIHSKSALDVVNIIFLHENITIFSTPTPLKKWRSWYRYGNLYS